MSADKGAILNMKYNLPDRILREIVYFAKEHSITKIILFGSRARGTNTERSDIDIAVYGGDFDGFYWDIKEKTKLDNFINCLTILANADFKMAETNDIYRTGVIGQFNLTFELAWKALQEIMRKHGVEDSSTGSPREILQLGYKFGFIDDSETWLLMLKKRNTSVHIYNEEEVDELILLIRDSFIPAFTALKDTLVKKLDEAESNWE